MKSKPVLGPGVSIDVQRLVETRALMQANSGGGKSYAIRKLCEITYGGAQQIIIDVDGEYHTLREKFDYVLAGQKGGDCPADVKSAAMLARRLLELNVSAIIDIYELGAQRTRFVKLFLEAMMQAPKELWHPVLVVIDEAHMFAPEKDKAESAGAVIDLMTRGRKRGFAGILATQRIAKLHKDAAAECNNKLIGRCGLDVDMKRAAAELGFTSREDMLSLRTLQPGEFYAFGPALSDEVKVVKVGAVTTPHLRAGQRAAAPSPPRERVKKILSQLADLPHEAEEEAKTVEELRLKNRTLEVELRKARTATKVETKETKVPVLDPKQVAVVQKLVTRLEKHSDKFDSVIAALDKQRDTMAQAQQAVVSEIGNLKTLARLQVEKALPPRIKATNLPAELIPDAVAIARQRVPRIGAQQHPPMGSMRRAKSETPTVEGVNEPRQRILDTLALLEQLEIEPEKATVAAWYGCHINNKGFTNNVGALRTMGLMNGFALTDEGRALAKPIAIPSQEQLRERLLEPLNKPQRAIVEALLPHTHGLSKDDLAAALGLHPNNKGFTNNVGKLRTRKVLTDKWPIKAGDVFYVRS